MPADPDTIILISMNSPLAAKNAPNPLQFLFSPAQSARSIMATGKGMAWVLAIWALDFLFQAPFTVSRWLMRASESPVSGLTTLWSFFVQASLLPAAGAALLGTLLYYKKRRDPEPWELWNSILVAGYCFMPHTLLLALSAWVGYGGYESAWLLHQRSSESIVSDIQALIHIAPVLFYGWLCVRPQETQASFTSGRRLQSIPLIILIGAVLTTGEHVANNQERARPLMKGDSLPHFAVYGTDGTSRILQKTKGKVLLIDVWATWCGPCVAAMPHLEQLHQQFEGQDFELISLNVEPERSKDVEAFMKDKQLSFPVYFDRGQARQRLMISLYPTVILVDETGKIDSIYNGTLGLAGLEGDIKRLLKL